MGAKCCCGAGCLKLDSTISFADSLLKVKAIKEIKGLCLTFPGKKLDKDAFSFFNDVFSTVKGITCLRWDLKKCDIDENEIKTIFECLSKQPQLQSIHMDLTDNPIKLQGAQFIKEALGTFKELKKVNIVLGNNGIDPEGEKSLGFDEFLKSVVKPAPASECPANSANSDVNTGKKDFEQRKTQGEQFADRILQLTNEYRAANGLEGLEKNVKATEIAQQYAKELAFKQKKYIWNTVHSGWDERCKKLGVSNETARENLGLKLKLENNSVDCMVEVWKNFKWTNENLLLKEAKNAGIAVLIFDEDDDDTFFDNVKDQIVIVKKKVLAMCNKKKEPEQRQLKYYFVQIIY